MVVYYSCTVYAYLYLGMNYSRVFYNKNLVVVARKVESEYKLVIVMHLHKT